MVKACAASCIYKTLPVSAVIFILFLIFSACSQEPTDYKIKEFDPKLAAEYARNSERLVNPEIEEGLTFNIWGSDSLVADPISIDIDDKGKIYYSRTNRRKISEFDIRSHQDWEIKSIKMQTVEDRRNFIRRELATENSEKNQWLPDLNRDGSHDWKDLTVEKENVYRLEDTDGDGIADKSQLVVEDFHEEVTDVAGALLVHNDELFVGVAPDLWRIKDNDNDGLADEKTSISHGYGVHIGFGGHNMSGLEMGPDGRLYWGIGDIGFNPEQKEWKFPNRGVIVRSNPDGSDFEVFAMGLRNTHEFVFDEYANLISVDNDGDHGGEKERLVYIVNGSDAGWRINWQFGKYRDPDNNTYKVWMDEELHKPRFEGQAAYITPPIASFINGPTGMVYNPGTALSPAWKNTFFVAEFVGNPSQAGIHSFKLKPKGASFELADQKKILGGILATGLEFGPDGAVYVADWIDGWINKGYGRIWKLDDPKGDSWEERIHTKEFLEKDLKKENSEFLGGMLKNPDQRVRQKAQFELVLRGSEGAQIFEQNLQQTESQLARVHAIIGLSQMARLEDMEYAEPLIQLLKDGDPEIRAQAAKWLGDIKYSGAGKDLIPLLKDNNHRARFFAAEALGRTGYEPAIPAIIELLESNNEEDAFIRHAASLALARIGKPGPILDLADHMSKPVRIGAVVALRRMEHPGIAKFLDDKDEFIVTETARAINDDFSIGKALPQLGNLLLKTSFTNEALIRRSINANLRVGSEEGLQNLIAYSQNEGAPLPLRTEALEAIATWAKPSVLDRVDGRYRGEVNRDIKIVQEAASDPLIQLLSSNYSEIRLVAVKGVGKLSVEEGKTQLLRVMKEDSNSEVRVAALRSLSQLPGEMDGTIKLALADKEKDLRVAGLDLLKQLNIEQDLMVELLAEVIRNRTMEEKQTAVLSLGTISSSQSISLLEELLEKLETGILPPEIHLELIEAIENSGSSNLIGRLEVFNKGLSPDSLTASYRGSLYGGDESLGSRIFFKNQSAQCIRCHSYDDMGGNAGPPLNGIANRLSREELLEALIEPSKRIAPGFGTVILELDNGQDISGVLETETEGTLTLNMGNRPDTLVSKKNVVRRENALSSMPDMKHLLSREEIRNLVSFLATLKEEEEE